MIADRYMPLSKAARIVGVHRDTLRKWLEADCGLVFPAPGRGRQRLVSERDIQTVIDLRTGRPNWSKRPQMVRQA